MRYCSFPRAELVLADCWLWISASAGAAGVPSVPGAAAGLLWQLPVCAWSHSLALLQLTWLSLCKNSRDDAVCTSQLLSPPKLQPGAVLPTSLSLLLCAFFREIIFILLPDGWFTRAVENIHSLSEHIFGLKASLR